MGLRYHFIELSTVTDDNIERAVNEELADGWTFDGMHFAMTAASKRPAMAFLAFTKQTDEDDDG